eukprot:CAMPEP_0171821696 /NCGR_PEP_ID=MMETSP0992-20121227/3460_1 /TAXON_ID=483369 /ORGANISM="non described non described, Strain CCMP2098" /LENGTH=69 /DNA_ID=CAMNT_0012436215 /DNA_START=468 /DNA_END=675 /DNA_ORIENTATION=-
MNSCSPFFTGLEIDDARADDGGRADDNDRTDDGARVDDDDRDNDDDDVLTTKNALQIVATETVTVFLGE